MENTTGNTAAGQNTGNAKDSALTVEGNISNQDTGSGSPKQERAYGRPFPNDLLGAQSILKGDITGEDDLLVEGRVEGSITLRRNALIVGKNAIVKARVEARTIAVEGEVNGELHASEQIVLHKNARVRGTLVCPRISIEPGARFTGSLDMDPRQGAAGSGNSPGLAQAA
jgi:cytoskeletal protein CcmA (bactofilin family)